MEFALNENLTLPTVASLLSDELVTQIPGTALTSIETNCNAIDTELCKIKFGMIEIGRSLNSIHVELKNVCFRENSSQVFELIVERRFGRKKSWAYQMMNIFHRFAENDPLLDSCSSSVLLQFSKLNDTEIDDIRTNLEKGEQITEKNAKDLVKLIIEQRESGNTIAELQEQVMTAAAQQKALENKLEKKNIEFDRLQRDLEQKEDSNGQLLQKLRDLQDEQRNLMTSLNQERESKAAAMAQIEEVRKKATQHARTVEVEVAPARYESIEESIRDIEKQMEDKQAALAEINARIEQVNQQLADSAAVSEKLAELHDGYSALAMKQLEILNRTRASDLQKSSDLIKKIVQMSEQLGADLLRQLA